MFLGVHFWENFRLLSETFLRVNSHLPFCQLSDSKVKLQNRQILKQSKNGSHNNEIGQN